MKYALGILAAAAMLAGCGGSQSTLTPPAGMNAIQTLGTPLYHGVTPDRRHREFGYISNFLSQVLVFDFPSGKSLGTVSVGVWPQGECTKGRGTWWVVSSYSREVEEFKAGGTTAIRTLPVTAGTPAFCAIDKATGDLAVTLAGIDDVVVFKRASGSGKEIPDLLYPYGSPGYDDKGDLFVAGTIASTGALVELPAGSSTFKRITLPNTINYYASNVQWDGRYLAVDGGDDIYRYSISGSTATLKGTVTYSGGCQQTWIEKGKFLCPDVGNNNVALFAYPAGGSPIKTWTGNFDEPIGSVVVDK